MPLRRAPVSSSGTTRHHPGVIAELLDDWGPVLALWEGFAGTPEIRLAGSSGGAASALAIDGIENQGMNGLLHIRARTDTPYLNETVYSTTRDEILAATGVTVCAGKSLRAA